MARVEYGVVYSLEEAKRAKIEYLRLHSGALRWQRNMRMQMPDVVRTASGHLRRFPNRDDGYTHRLNTPIQGTACDGAKRGMILLRVLATLQWRYDSQR